MTTGKTTEPWEITELLWPPGEMADLMDALARSADRNTLSYSEAAHLARHAAKTIRHLDKRQAQGTLWQLIETAPRDGSAIDLWCRNISQGSAGEVRAADMWWDEDVDRWVDRTGVILEQKWKPTHWMPLPEAPRLEEGRR